MASGQSVPLTSITVDSSSPIGLSEYAGNSIQEKISNAIKKHRVLLIGRSSCPFCIEASRTLKDLGVDFPYFKVDQIEEGAALHQAMKEMTGQKTVPYVYINGKLVGGCDALKASIQSGEFDTLLGDLETTHDEKEQLISGVAGVDDAAPVVSGALFNFPNTVENRIIRLVGLQIMVTSVLLTVFYKRHPHAWNWVAVGMLSDFALRFYAGAGISPLGSVAMLLTAMADLFFPMLNIKSVPRFVPGVPKQFAASIGITFSAIIVALRFTDHMTIAAVFSAVLAFFAALEGLFNFCAGCWVFQKAIKYGIISDTIYMIHINTLPETKYTWTEKFKRVYPPAPIHTRKAFKTHPTGTKIDLHYKTGKDVDVERESFDFIKYSKIGFFSSVVGVVAIPAQWKFASMSSTFNTPDLVWQILTILSLVYTAFFTFPYLLKMVMYPRKVVSEWMNPVMNNAFSVPSMVLIVYAFLAITYSRTLAKVLFWAGASTVLPISIAIMGEWMSCLRHEGHINGAVQMAPVGNFIAAVVAPMVDPAYSEIAVLWLGVAAIMYGVLFTITFHRFFVHHNADPRQRMFAGIWIAEPAVFAVAWSILINPATFQMDLFAKMLFYFALVMGVLVLYMVHRHFLWMDFKMNMWAFGFPTAALAWAGILYNMSVTTVLAKILAVVLVSIANFLCVVLVLRTFIGVFRRKVFIPEHKWGPMSHLPLAHEAQRFMMESILKTVSALKQSPGNKRLTNKVKEEWRTFATVNSAYIDMKDNVCFANITGFFPGATDRFKGEHAAILELQEKIETALKQILLEKGPEAAVEASTAAFEELPGTTTDEKISSAVKTNRIMVVGRSTCPFCIEVSRTLSEMKLPFTYFKVDQISEGAALHAVLKEKTGQKTVPYVYVNGQLVGGCDATKAAIASGEFDSMLAATGGATPANSQAGVATLEGLLQKYHPLVLENWLAIEDHVRPIVRRYVSQPVQKKIMNDCWDHIAPETWFHVLPSVVRYLPMHEQRVTYVSAFCWALPERAQQIGTMVALGTDPVSWYKLRISLPAIIPRGETGWKHYQ